MQDVIEFNKDLSSGLPILEDASCNVVSINGVGIPMDIALPNMAVDIAAGLYNETDLMGRYGLSQAQMDRVKTSPHFMDMMAEALKEFDGGSNAGKRTRMKAAMASEASLPILWDILKDTDLSTSARIEASKMFHKLSGAEAEHSVNGTGFSITINLSGKDPMKIVGTAPQPIIDQAAE